MGGTVIHERDNNIQAGIKVLKGNHYVGLPLHLKAFLLLNFNRDT